MLQTANPGLLMVLQKELRLLYETKSRHFLQMMSIFQVAGQRRVAFAIIESGRQCLQASSHLLCLGVRAQDRVFAEAQQGSLMSSLFMRLIAMTWKQQRLNAVDASQNPVASHASKRRHS